MPASTVFAAALREEAHRELISVECSSDRLTQCRFLRVSMKSLLWLWSLREIVAENAKEECETVFCAIGIKIPMVPYLNESCMSLSGMSPGPYGQTSVPAHEFSSAEMSNEVCYKSCCLHKSIHNALQRDNCVCFDSHSGSPADPALFNVNCSGNSSQFCGGDSWYTFHLMYLWVAPVRVDLLLECRSQLGTTCQCPRQFVSIISTRLFLASARATADSILRAMNLSVILS